MGKARTNLFRGRPSGKRLKCLDDLEVDHADERPSVLSDPPSSGVGGRFVGPPVREILEDPGESPSPAEETSAAIVDDGPNPAVTSSAERFGFLLRQR